jgi:hypothetical protein
VASRGKDGRPHGRLHNWRTPDAQSAQIDRRASDNPPSFSPIPGRATSGTPGAIRPGVLRNPRLRAAGALVVLGTIAGLFGRLVGGPARTPSASQDDARGTQEARPSPPKPVSTPPAHAAPVNEADDEEHDVPAAGNAEGRRARLAWTLRSYLEWAQYPPSSRPARERADRLRPHASAPRHLPLSTGDGKRTEARVVLWQSHVYLAGQERAALTVACERGPAPVPCAVRSAVATSDLPETPFAPVPLAFVDDGRGADRAAGDGVLSVTFAPREQGLAGFTGPVRVTLEVDAGGERGAATFALFTTAEAPATFTGATRERLAGGSLEVCLEMRVREAGRYLIDARVDDATGESFAFVTFDGELAQGTDEACFQIFGKLVRDEEAQAPFTLRDVEGFRLLEDTFPDRHTVPTWEGRVHTTKKYAPEDLSDAPWESEMKARYVAGLRARAGLDDAQ